MVSQYDYRKIAVGILVLIVILGLLVYGVIFIVSKFKEDDWIKDSRGLYLMHGNSSSTPTYVIEQQEAISCASSLYASASIANMSFNSQCLGTCGNYSIDIVNVPRISEDNLAENQCADYLLKKTTHFIELNKQGNIVRIN
jgi:predicted permease